MRMCLFFFIFMMVLCFFLFLLNWDLMNLRLFYRGFIYGLILFLVLFGKYLMFLLDRGMSGCVRMICWKIFCCFSVVVRVSSVFLVFVMFWRVMSLMLLFSRVFMVKVCLVFLGLMLEVYFFFIWCSRLVSGLQQVREEFFLFFRMQKLFVIFWLLRILFFFMVFLRKRCLMMLLFMFLMVILFVVCNLCWFIFFVLQFLERMFNVFVLMCRLMFLVMRIILCFGLFFLVVSMVLMILWLFLLVLQVVLVFSVVGFWFSKMWKEFMLVFSEIQFCKLFLRDILLMKWMIFFVEKFFVLFLILNLLSFFRIVIGIVMLCCLKCMIVLWL